MLRGTWIDEETMKPVRLEMDRRGDGQRSLFIIEYVYVGRIGVINDESLSMVLRARAHAPTFDVRSVRSTE